MSGVGCVCVVVRDDVCGMRDERGEQSIPMSPEPAAAGGPEGGRAERVRVEERSEEGETHVWIRRES